MRRVFEIVSIHSGTRFSLGYCRGYRTTRINYVLRGPFRRAAVYVPFGELPCSGPWTGPHEISRCRHEIVETSWQGWMQFSEADMLTASHLCIECSTRLPRGGFRRL